MSEGGSVVGVAMIRVDAVAEKIGISVRAVWRLRNEDATFPRPRKLGKSTLWFVNEIDDYLRNLPIAEPGKPKTFSGAAEALA